MSMNLNRIQQTSISNVTFIESGINHVGATDKLDRVINIKNNDSTTKEGCLSKITLFTNNILNNSLINAIKKSEMTNKIANITMTSLSKTCSTLKNICYKNSIFFALNYEALANESIKYKDFTTAQKFVLGLKLGTLQMIPSTILIFGLGYALQCAPDGAPPTKDNSADMTTNLFIAVMAAIIEELLFRGIFQNCTALLQVVTFIRLPHLQKNRTFQWMMSPSARIISINSLFALGHLRNAGGYLSTKKSIVQMTRIMLMPTEGILNEICGNITTGNFFAPLGTHIANNAIVALPIGILRSR